MDGFDWDDLRHFLAVARTGSTLGGARRLGVNQTTCARRVAALEAAMGATLFERRQAGYRLTEVGQRVVALAERVEAEVAALSQTVQADRRVLAGTLRVTTSETLANMVLTPFIGRFREAHPRARVDVAIDDRKFDIARGEADIALRAGRQPEKTGVVVRRICFLPWTVYGARDHAARHGLPRTPEALARHGLIGGEGALADIPGSRWLERIAGPGAIVSRSGSLTNMMAGVAAGLGLAALPCMLADREPALVRCFPPVPEIGDDLWLVAREELREVPLVRAFLDGLVAHIAPLKPLMEGGNPEVVAQAAALG